MGAIILNKGMLDVSMRRSTCILDGDGVEIFVGDTVEVTMSIAGNCFRKFRGTVSYGIYTTEFGHDGSEGHLGLYISDVRFIVGKDDYMNFSLYAWCSDSDYSVRVVQNK